MTKKQKKAWRRIIIAAAGLILINIISHFVVIGGNSFGALLYGIPLAVIYIAIYIVIGGDILKKAFQGM